MKSRLSCLSLSWAFRPINHAIKRVRKMRLSIEISNSLGSTRALRNIRICAKLCKICKEFPFQKAYVSEKGVFRAARIDPGRGTEMIVNYSCGSNASSLLFTQTKWGYSSSNWFLSNCSQSLYQSRARQNLRRRKISWAKLVNSLLVRFDIKAKQNICK